MNAWQRLEYRINNLIRWAEQNPEHPQLEFVLWGISRLMQRQFNVGRYA